MRRCLRFWLLVGFTLAAVTVVAFLPHVPQSQSYHNFVDQRLLLAIPNCINVISNLPFLVVGLWGVILVMQRRTPRRGAFDNSGRLLPSRVTKCGRLHLCWLYLRYSDRSQLGQSRTLSC